MTAIELVRQVKAKRYGKGKWMAKCPAHREKTASLSITQMSDGIRLHCFAGCSQKSVIDALGLTWADLRNESRVDYEVLRQIAAVEAKRKAEKDDRTKLLWNARQHIEFWHRRSQQLGVSLGRFPEAVKLGRDFHHALDMERRAQKVWESL